MASSAKSGFSKAGGAVVHSVSKSSHYTLNTFAQMTLPAYGFQLDNHMCTDDLN